MKPREQWHVSLTDQTILDAVERRSTTLDDPGFCLSCGCGCGGVEPDAQRYRCEVCGERQVYGVEELLLSL
jgi:hypothetical protein